MGRRGTQTCARMPAGLSAGRGTAPAAGPHVTVSLALFSDSELSLLHILNSVDGRAAVRSI
jgi:hypothetical protein